MEYTPYNEGRRFFYILASSLVLGSFGAVSSGVVALNYLKNNPSGNFDSDCAYFFGAILVGGLVSIVGGTVIGDNIASLRFRRSDLEIKTKE